MSSPEAEDEESVSAGESERSSGKPPLAPQSHGAASPRGDMEDLASLHAVLRTVAAALKQQADLLNTVVDKCMSGEAKANTLSTIRIPEFDRHPNTPANT